jgi:hypothetical protein
MIDVTEININQIILSWIQAPSHWISNWFEKIIKDKGAAIRYGAL